MKAILVSIGLLTSVSLTLSLAQPSANRAPDRFYALQEMVTRMRGIESGHKQAEGYIRHVQSSDFALPMAS